MTRLLLAAVAVLTIAGVAALAHHGPYWLLTSLDDEGMDGAQS